MLSTTEPTLMPSDHLPVIAYVRRKGMHTDISRSKKVCAAIAMFFVAVAGACVLALSGEWVIPVNDDARLYVALAVPISLCFATPLAVVARWKFKHPLSRIAVLACVLGWLAIVGFICFVVYQIVQDPAAFMPRIYGLSPTRWSDGICMLHSFARPPDIRCC